MFYIWKGSISESECELLTTAEKLRKEARDMKIKRKTKTSNQDKQKSSTPAKPPYPLPKKVSKKREKEPYQDEWDYDLKKLALNEWVAVAYKEGFYIGKVEKILAHKVRINFLSEDDQGSFIWPRVSDKQDIKAIFIFRRNVEVTQAHEDATKFNVKNITLIKDRFQAFSLKYF